MTAKEIAKHCVDVGVVKGNRHKCDNPLKNGVTYMDSAEAKATKIDVNFKLNKEDYKKDWDGKKEAN